MDLVNPVIFTQTLSLQQQVGDFKMGLARPLSLLIRIWSTRFFCPRDQSVPSRDEMLKKLPSHSLFRHATRSSKKCFKICIEYYVFFSGGIASIRVFDHIWKRKKAIFLLVLAIKIGRSFISVCGKTNRLLGLSPPPPEPRPPLFNSSFRHGWWASAVFFFFPLSRFNMGRHQAIIHD